MRKDSETSFKFELGKYMRRRHEHSLFDSDFTLFRDLREVRVGVKHIFKSRFYFRFLNFFFSFLISFFLHVFLVIKDLPICKSLSGPKGT